MATDKSSDWLFCNYCGEALSIEGAYNHVSKYHGDKIHSDLLTYDPGKRRRILAAQIAGSFALLVSVLAVLLMFGAEMTGAQVWLLIVLVGAGIALLFGGGEYLARRGEKPTKDIVEDLLVLCQICDTKVPWRDRQLHDELVHPDEQVVVKNVYEPVAILVLLLVGVGFGGMYLTTAFGEGGRGQQTTLLAAFFAFMLCAAVGMILAVLFETKYHRPRMERLSSDWRSRHRRNFEEIPDEKT